MTISNYDLNIKWAIHTVRVTLQFNNYVGHIVYRIKGNVKGYDIIENATSILEEFNGRCVENDCQFAFNEDEGRYTATLKAENGDTCLIEEYDFEDIADMITAVEIIAFEPDESEGYHE